jgi:hypothetical protein
MTGVEQALLYARTARHLKPTQWLHWPLRRLQAIFPAPARGVRVAWDAEAAARLGAVVAGWGPADAEARLCRAESILADAFCFLNHCETLPQIDWRRRHVSHLWSYNLHYFDYALDLAWAYRLTGDTRFPMRFEALVDSWCEAHRERCGDGWEPYPVSLRIVNWSYALLLFEDALSRAFRERLKASLAEQAALLSRRLELHLLANHLQKNLKALAIAGLLFRGREAARWRRLGFHGLWRELFEQVLPDGGHFERSPMYHAIALVDYLEIVSLGRAAGQSIPADCIARVREMVRAFGWLSRPDGSLHLLNDSANGIAPSRGLVEFLASQVVGASPDASSGAFSLPHTGYFGYRDESRGERLIIDCGDPAPRYQPGHAHCDLLSFELDLAGHPVVVDSGVSGYMGDFLREYVRSTRAHNTVMIAGREQSEVWSTFRMARGAQVGAAEQSNGVAGYRFRGSYRPYHDRRCLHERTIEGDRERWVVTDRVHGAAGAPLAGFLHFHPAFHLEGVDGGVIARSPGVTLMIEPFGTDRLEIRQGERRPIQGWYCPEFGVALPACVLEMQVESNREESFGYALRRIDR